MTDITKFKVADAFRHLDPSQGLADDISSGFSSLRCKGKAWTLHHGGKVYPFKQADGYQQPFVDLVILGIGGISKVYFGEWNEDNASGPICASLKGDVPDPGVSIPQSKTCATCEHNEWITKPGGGRGKECQDHKRMAVLLMPSMTAKMLPAPLLEPVYFKIPPGSFKSLKKYSDGLQHSGIPFAAIITRVSFAEGSLFEMKFDILQALTNAEAPLVLPMMESNQTKSIIGNSAQVRQLAAPATAVPERIDTGLLQAFGAPDAAPAAAPKTRAPRAKKVDTVIDAEPNPAPPPADVNNNDGEPWEESDTDLDETVRNLMNKTNNMLK